MVDIHNITLFVVTYLNSFMKKQFMLLSQQRITPRGSDLVAGLFPQSRAVLHRYVAHPHTYWTGSGREALRLVLSNCRIERAATTVAVPAFTCQAVIDAVRRSGCTPLFYDSGIIPNFADIKSVISKVDVLLLVYNFGFLPPVDEIATLCRKHNVILVEDCAQALGARWENQLAGGFGEYAVYSFGISKNIGFCGGLIASKEPLVIPKLPVLPEQYLRSAIIRTVAAPLFFQSSLYPLFRPFLREELDKHLEPLTYGPSAYARRVVLHQLKRYEKILALRRKNAVSCQEKIISSVPIVTGSLHDSGLYLVLMDKNRLRVQRELEKYGVEFAVMRTFRCFERGNPNAFKAEQEHLTFAFYRSKKEIDKVVRVLNKCYNQRD